MKTFLHIAHVNGNGRTIRDEYFVDGREVSYKEFGKILDATDVLDIVRKHETRYPGGVIA